MSQPQDLDANKYTRVVNMDDIFEGVDDLLDISDEEIAGVIEGNHSGDMCIPLEEEYLFSVDDYYKMDWMKEYIEGQDKKETFADLIGKTVEEQGPENNTESAIISDLSSDSDNNGKNTMNLSSRVTIPGKPRSKRSKTALSNWASKPISTNGSENSSESSTLISPDDGGLSQSEWLAYEQVEYQSPMKFSMGKCGKEKEVSAEKKCSHCGASKTPQWRGGPLGPKTLCNACGVRYKSGGLLPEYRPAASPSFTPDKHSNVNKVVLEMRRRKSVMGVDSVLGKGTSNKGRMD